MRYVLFSIALVCTPVRAADWSPPEKPDPQAILEEATGDAIAKRYDTALAKHVWFHENAVSIDPAFYGVRQSFALAYWVELAKEYPPALKKLKEIRDQAKKNVVVGKDVRKCFQDLEAINEHLKEQSETKKVFEILDENSPKMAEQVFDLAQRSLVQGKAYSLVGKYIAPKEDFAKMREMYRQAKRFATAASDLDFAKKLFANDTTTLVAILAVNGRKTEAEEIAAAARAEWDDGTFNAQIEKALAGVVPDPWP